MVAQNIQSKQIGGLLFSHARIGGPIQSPLFRGRDDSQHIDRHWISSNRDLSRERAALKCLVVNNN